MSLQTRLSKYIGEDTTRRTLLSALVLTAMFPIYMHALRASAISEELLLVLYPTFGVLEFFFIVILCSTGVKLLYTHVLDPQYALQETFLPEQTTLNGGTLASAYAIVCIDVILLHTAPFTPFLRLLDFLLRLL